METTGYASEGSARAASGPRVGFLRRLGGALLDGILVGIVEAVLEAAIKGPVGSLAALVVSAAYVIVLIGGPRGQTIGQKAVGIRVIDYDTGGSIGYARAFIRWIGGIVSFVVILLGYLWMLWDKEKQCWHDKFAGDVVVPESAYPIQRG